MLESKRRCVDLSVAEEGKRVFQERMKRPRSRCLEFLQTLVRFYSILGIREANVRGSCYRSCYRCQSTHARGPLRRSARASRDPGRDPTRRTPFNLFHVLPRFLLHCRENLTPSEHTARTSTDGERVFRRPGREQHERNGTGSRRMLGAYCTNATSQLVALSGNSFS